MYSNYNTKTQNNQNLNQNPFITSDTFDYITKNVLRYKESKSRTKKLLNHIDTLSVLDIETNKLSNNVIKSVEDCGSWLEFRNYFEVDKTKLHNANFCKKDKLCPACAMRRASKQVKKVMTYFDENPEFKKKYWYYIVLPVRHNASESFTTVFDRARSGLNTLRKSINNNKMGKGHKSFFSQFDGLMYSFEVTKTKSGWNNHINLLCCSSTPVEDIYKYTFKDGKSVYQHKGIMEDWAKYTDNKSFMHSINKIDVSNEDVLIKNLLEIFKYSMKFQSLENKDLLEAYKSTYKKRLLGSFGSLYGIKTDVSLNGDEVLGDKFLEIIFRYNFWSKEYFEYSRKIRDVECKDRSYGKNNYKYIDVVNADTKKVVCRLPVKQKRVIKHNVLSPGLTQFQKELKSFAYIMRGLF